jgi:hypothetical protein
MIFLTKNITLIEITTLAPPSCTPHQLSWIAFPHTAFTIELEFFIETKAE